MKVGDYVRDNMGFISKIKLIKQRKIASTTNWDIYKSEIIKSSSSIIDLIEVGDYVNGKRVEWIGYKLYQDNGKECKGIGDKIILFNEFTKDYISEKHIKSIVTKEQFEAIKYEIK